MTPNEILKMREDMMTDERHEEIVKVFNELETGEMFQESDPVHNPSHYNQGDMEVIDVIDNYVPDPYGYYMGNVMKYLMRHLAKGKPKQDLEKARWYLNKMIEDWND